MRPPRAKPDKARQAARELVRRFEVADLPVPIECILHALGVELRFAQFQRDLSGVAHIKEGVPIIIVNAKHHPNRQRFTLAHELGHVMLHRPLLERVVHVDRGSLKRDAVSAMGTDAHEIEANAFASELLIPQVLLDAEVGGRQIDMEEDGIIDELARRFQVSVAAMRFRLQG